MFPPRIGVIPLTHETGQGCDLLICLEPAARLARTERRTDVFVATAWWWYYWSDYNADAGDGARMLTVGV